MLGEVYPLLGEAYLVLGAVYLVLGEVYLVLGEVYLMIRKVYPVITKTVVAAQDNCLEKNLKTCAIRKTECFFSIISLEVWTFMNSNCAGKRARLLALNENCQKVSTSLQNNYNRFFQHKSYQFTKVRGAYQKFCTLTINFFIIHFTCHLSQQL